MDPTSQMPQIQITVPITLWPHLHIIFIISIHTTLFHYKLYTESKKFIQRAYAFTERIYLLESSLTLLLPSSRDTLCQFWRASTPPQWTDQRHPFSYRTWSTVRSTLPQGSAYCCSGTSQRPAEVCNTTHFHQQLQMTSPVRTGETTQQLFITKGHQVHSVSHFSTCHCSTDSRQCFKLSTILSPPLVLSSAEGEALMQLEEQEYCLTMCTQFCLFRLIT